MTPPRRFACVAVVACVSTASIAAAQDEFAKVTGRVTDGSGAALPGVTITLASPELAAPVTVVTDGVGQFVTPALAAGTYSVAFDLTGFETQTRRRIELRAGDLFILDERLEVATLKESVEVVAAAPPPPPPPPPPAPPAPPVRLSAPKRPEPVPVAREILASVCGPGQATSGSLTVGRLVAHRDERNRSLYGNGDVLLIDAGADIGLVAGQNLVVRRPFPGASARSSARSAAVGQQTAGLVQVVETGERMSVAVVVYTCGELFAGDTVEPFDGLPQLTAQRSLEPQYEDPAHIVLGDHGQTLGAERQLMVIDRGTVGGAVRGQRLTVFRRSLGDRGPVHAIADAIIVAVQAESATIRIERTSDAVTVGDLVALHR